MERTTQEWRDQLIHEQDAMEAKWERDEAQREWSEHVGSNKVASWLADHLAGPWAGGKVGFPRKRIRKTIYHLILIKWLVRLRLAQRRLDKLSEYLPFPGRYEGNASQSIAEWLDEQDADWEAGDTETVGYWRIVEGPWPWPDDLTEAYVLHTSSSGFIDYTGTSLSIANEMLGEIEQSMEDDEPRCDICEQVEDWYGEGDWNGDTGNHLTCEAKERDQAYPAMTKQEFGL